MTAVTTLGRTGLTIHPIGLGANKIGEENKETNTEYGGKIITAALDNGLNFIDTAFMYGKGLSEEIIGKTLKESGRRNEAVIATKASHIFKGEDVTISNTPDFLTKSVDGSLKRLQTDRIDLFYIHFPDKDTPKYEAIGALQRLKEAGKIRAIGVSNFSLEQLKEANQDGYLDVVQDHYNLLHRSAEHELFPFMLENGISFIPYFPLASGLLAGKYHEDSVLSDYLKAKPQFQGDAFARNVEKVDKLKAIADRHDVSTAHLVLAFYLSLEPVDAVIPGARNADQVVDNLKAAEVNLTETDIAAIEELFPIK